MKALRAFFLRLTGTFGTFGRFGTSGARRPDREIDEELRTHLEMMVDDQRRRGLSDADARRRAGAAFGSVASAAETVRDRRGLPALERWMRDIRYAARSLSRSPGPTLAMILVLALGVGLATALATIFHAIVWRPLPVPEPDRVVKLALTLEGQVSRGIQGHPSWFSYPELTALASGARAFEGIAGERHEATRWRREGTSLALATAVVTPNYFDLLRVKAARGRLFTAEDERQLVVVIGHRLWTEAFGGDPAAVGQTMVLDRSPYTIVGIAERGFSGVDMTAADAWLPVAAASAARGNSARLTQPNISWLPLIARLAPGQEIAAARAEAAVIAARLDAEFPGRRATIAVTEASLLDPGYFSSERDRPKLVVAGSVMTLLVSVVLLICASNVAGLLLARGASRQKETAIRIALGAGRLRIVQQLAAESLLIAFVAMGVGLLLCTWALRVAASLTALRGPLDGFTPDATVLIFAMLAALGAALLFGIAPALQTLDVDPLPALKQDGSRFGRRMPAARLRHALVSLQVALSLVLLVVSALLARGVQQTLRLDPGYVTTGLQVVSVDVAPPATPGAARPPIVRTLRDAIAATPGTQAIGLTGTWPFGSPGQMPVRPAQGSQVQSFFDEVDAGYFRALGVSPAAGRLFEPGEQQTVVLVNARLARMFWGGEPQAIGQTLELLGNGNRWQGRTVVGVIPTLQTASVSGPDGPTFYLQLDDRGIEGARLLVRAAPGVSFQRLARDTVNALDSEAAPSVVSVDERIAGAAMPARVGMAVAGSIGALALLIAAIGIYGIVAYGAACRTKEMGVHLALGASRGRVLWLIVGSSLRAVVRGAIAGALIVVIPAMVFARALAPMLLGVSPLDPIATFAAVAFLLLVTMGAAYLPARRSLGLGPVVALRSDT